MTNRFLPMRSGPAKSASTSIHPVLTMRASSSSGASPHPSRRATTVRRTSAQLANAAKRQPRRSRSPPPFRAGLGDLEAGQYVHLLTWLGRARRDLAVQSPRHAERPRSTFSLRSPLRPNPIGLHLVRIDAIDASTGRIAIDAIDVLDGTALLDIKPFFATVDVPPSGTSES